MRSYDDIAACAAEYATVRDALTDRAQDLAVYERVLRARVALAECLLEAGWNPPQDIADLLALDRQLLAQPRSIERE